MNPDPNRRRLLLAAAAWLLASGARAATRLDPTPAQSRRPVLSHRTAARRRPRPDPGARRASAIAQGRITDLSGRLLDRDGRPISATRIEIWQCDATGRYHHPLDRGGARDPNFQGFGHAVTDADRPLPLSHHPAGALSRPHPPHSHRGVSPGRATLHHPALRPGRTPERRRLSCSTGFPRNGDRGCWPTSSPSSGTASNWRRASI
ncbi:MAG: intradiol ring-cleavage dioxygenase [Chromatiales bacterium]|nr:intradiol ring-cleavage dioxygenase [Chromatiales bacterium]